MSNDRTHMLIRQLHLCTCWDTHTPPPHTPASLSQSPTAQNSTAVRAAFRHPHVQPTCARRAHECTHPRPREPTASLSFLATHYDVLARCLSQGRALRGAGGVRGGRGLATHGPELQHNTTVARQSGQRPRGDCARREPPERRGLRVRDPDPGARPACCTRG